MQNALKESALVPIGVVELTRKIMMNSLSVDFWGNFNVIADAGISPLLLETEAIGIFSNAIIGLYPIYGTDFAQKCCKEMNFDSREIERATEQIFDIFNLEINIS